MTGEESNIWFSAFALFGLSIIQYGFMSRALPYMFEEQGATISLAYIDPGTGSLLISVIIGGFLTLLYNLKGFFYRVITKISGGVFKGNNDYTGKLVFFNEGKKYWSVFKPVFDNLSKTKQEFVYLSADKDDPGLNYEYELCVKQYIGKINKAIPVLNSIKAKMCVMTTPQLNILNLKRSRHVQHYCNILHAPSDIHVYRKFAFDDFDSILCTSKYQIENLRQLEKDRNTRTKQLFETGCTYYDNVELIDRSEGDSILIGPTWGDKSFLSNCGEEMIEKILESKHKVILRPHPQSWISDKELLDDLISKFESNPLFSFDREVTNTKALSRAKVLICDLSGIIYDVSFIHKKPVIAIEYKWGDGGYESSDLINKQSSKYLLEDIGKMISENDIFKINNIISEVVMGEFLPEIVDKHIFNFQNASKVATEQIISIFKSIE